MLALLYRERGYTRAELRGVVPDYQEATTDSGFERMFERDKQELRALGFPIEEVPESLLFEDDATFRYRIPRGSFTLPPLRFTAEETAVLGLAANAWTEASLGTVARRALRKLEPVLEASAVQDEPSPMIQPTVTVQEPAFAPLMEAVLRHRQVRFDYLAASTDEQTHRRLEPWGVGSRFGSWYVTGWDLDRQAERTFRLSRIVSEVRATAQTFEPPAGFSMNDRLDALEASPALGSVAVDVAPGRGQMLRRMASAESLGAGTDGRDRLLVPVTEPERVADEVAAVGPDAFMPSPELADLPEADPLDAELGAADPLEALLQPGQPEPRLQTRVRASVLRRLRGAAQFQQRLRGAEVDWNRPSRRSRRTSTSSSEHLARLLEIVRYVYGHQGVDISEVAEHVEVDVDQVVEDLGLLFVCGRPGHTPDQLIEASWDGGPVNVSNAEEISDPVRLTQPEAAALMIGLQTLRSLPGEQTPAIDSALRKVAEAAGEPATVVDAVGARADTALAAASLEAAGHDEPEPLPEITAWSAAQDPIDSLVDLVRGAIDDRRRVRIQYIVASRDEVTEREIDPLHLTSSNTYWYVIAWCTKAQALREFRLDRVRSALVVGDAEVHEDPASRPQLRPRDPALSAETEIALVTDRRSRWIADQYRATRTAVVELPPLEGVAAEEAAVEEAPAARGRGGRPPVEFEAAQISFTTAEQAFSLVTRYGGQLGALAPPPVVQAGEQWVNTAMAPYLEAVDDQESELG
ncbi:hypothetical protein GCM10009594_07870 [Kocuria palustris]|uniref:WYL domain-containing protein n=1 Tax=Kocuria palustris TaxID=71999 RepID=UPI00045E714D|nr:WYL domain-containing protein [Kocuria palustris]MBM7821895.1 proteasome accessory factor B/proteasome accessory factor C [Kocuria palustris]